MIVKCTSELACRDYDNVKKSELQEWVDNLPDSALIYLGSAPEAHWTEKR